jgi:biotin carboxylase
MILHVFTEGSAPPSSVALAAERHGGSTAVVAPDDARAVAMVPVLREFGPVVLAADAESVVRELGGVRPRGVVTFAESTLPLAADLAARFGLPGPSPATVELLTDKAAQRARLNERGLGQVRSVAWDGGALPAHPPLPAVVKPRRGAGSEETYFVADAAALAEVAARLTPGRGYVIEERLFGAPGALGPWLADYVSVESAVDAAGRIGHLGVTGRLPLAAPARETGLVFPVRPEPAQEAELLALAAAAVAALGAGPGLVHTEIKLTPAGPVVIEVNGRLGGGLHRLMPRAGLADPVALALDLAVGADVPDSFGRAWRHTLHHYVQPPLEATAVLALPAPAALRALPGVFGAERRARPGAEVDWRRGSGERVLDVWLEGETLEELRARTEALTEALADTITWRY